MLQSASREAVSYGCMFLDYFDEYAGWGAMRIKDARFWINNLNLQRHPEGGYFREIFRSDDIIPQSALPRRFSGDRCCMTSIYFLLSKGEVSALHRLKSDEIWYYHDGSPLTVYVIDDGTLVQHRIGLDVASGETPQVVIRAGSWFGACLEGEGEYSLVGCAVAPGFDFADFELASRSSFLEQYPEHRSVIQKLTK